MKFTPIVAFLLAAPLMAQNQMTVTGSDGPGVYVPLASNASVLNSPEIKDMNAPAQMQAVILEQSAIIHNDTVHGLPSGVGAAQTFTQTIPPVSNPAVNSTTTPIPATSPATSAASGTASYTPPPFNTLANSVSFIQHQIADSTDGLPQTYYNPSGVPTGNPVIDNGIGTYDTSLSLIALIQSGNLSQAQKILDIYNSGVYGPPPNSGVLPPAAEVLSAYPAGNNGEAFAPFNSNAYYYFDIADTNAKYESSWQQYGSHTGPNAWLALAICQYIQAERKAGMSDTALTPYLTMVSRIGNAMILLQDGQAQGAVRYGPHQTYEDPFNTVNSENNVDAYSAFNSIAQVMQQSTLTSFSSTASSYSTASGKIINWLKNGTFYKASGQKQIGMRDPTTGLLDVGATFQTDQNGQNGKWVLQSPPAEDSGGSWTISALGPKLIDSMWGKGAALEMWESIRSQFGRTESQSGNPATIEPAGPTDPLIGVDYSNIYSADQSLISPEWTGGAINAVKQLLSYYTTYTSPAHGHAPPPNGISASASASLSADLQSMQNFLAQGQDAYAIGPGLSGSRQGNTGFDWQAPLNSSVAAMASIYGTLGVDPLAAWRSTAAPSAPSLSVR